MIRTISLGLVCLALVVTVAVAEETATTSSKHFQVVFENAKVRVLRARIDAKDKTEQHERADAVVVPLADYDVTVTQADGKTSQGHRKAGEAYWIAGSTRVVEAGDRPVDAIVVEIKSPPAAGN